MGEAGLVWGGLLSGCRVFCLFLGVWLPSLPRSGVAWSRLSSALFIVYLPNEGGGTLRHVIDSSVLIPVAPPPPPQPSLGRPGLWLLAEMCSKGEGGQDWEERFFFFHTACFCGKFFFVLFFPWTLLLWAGLVERGLWDSGVMADTHIPVPQLSDEDDSHDDSSAFLFLHLTQFLSWALRTQNCLPLFSSWKRGNKKKNLFTHRVVHIWQFWSILSTPPQRQRRVNLLPWEKRTREGGKRKKGNVESQILGLCSFRSVVDFKETSGTNEESADLSGQTHWAQRDTHTHTLPHCCNLTQWGGGNIYF